MINRNSQEAVQTQSADDMYALGVLAMGARLGIKKMPCSVSIHGSKRAVISFYEQTFQFTTLLATFRDLFIKIGVDFDDLVPHREVGVTTLDKAGLVVELPHSGIGAWAQLIEIRFGREAREQFLCLMHEARDEWIANYKDLYLPSEAESSKTLVNSLFRFLTIRPFNRAIKRNIKHKELKSFIESVNSSLPPSNQLHSAVMLYLFATFGAHSLSWEMCIDSIEKQCQLFDVDVDWGHSDMPSHVLVHSTGERLQVDPFVPYGVGPFFELMNAELAASEVALDHS